MKLRLLGPVEAAAGGRDLPLGRRLERRLLAVLALQPGHVVSIERLIDLLWGDEPPTHARAAIQAMVSHLRATLRRAGDDGPLLVSHRSGYALQINPDDVDLHEFRQLVGRARRLARASDRARLLAEALELWRGPILADTFDDAGRAQLCADVEELRVAAREEWLEARLDSGEHRDTIAALKELIEDHPLREHAVELLMTALHRCDRTGEALQAYDVLASRLSDELGLEPALSVQRLRTAILRDEPDLRIAVTAGSASIPAQLPAAPTSLVGRAEAMRRLNELIWSGDGAASIVAITGTAGVGKSALALAWAHGSLGGFPDGQIYLDLRGHSRDVPARPLEALAHLLSALGVPAAQLPVDVHRATALYRTVVARKRLLIVLDNAADADQVRPLLPGGPDARVVITSRDQLTGLIALQGARHIKLDVLTVEQSLDLLRHIVGTERQVAEPDAARQFVDECGRLPLALRIAMARLLSDPELTIAGHVAQLRTGRLAALTVENDGDAAVRTALEASYRRLSPAVARMFRALGLVKGASFTVDAAAAIAGVEAAPAERALSALADAHLTRSDATDRHALYDLLQLYAGELSAAEESHTDRADAVQRLLTWYEVRAAASAQLTHPGLARLPREAPELFDNQQAALAWLESELPTIVRLLTQRSAPGHERSLCVVADQLRGYFGNHGTTVEWLAVGRAALGSAEATGDDRLLGAAHRMLGQLHFATADYHRARAHHRRALRHFGRDGRPEDRASVLNPLGAICYQMGDLDRATRYLEHALSINRRTAAYVGIASALNNLGNLYGMRGNLELAHDRHRAALELHLANGSNAAAAYNNLALDLISMAREEDAQQQIDGALAVARATGSVNAEVNALTTLALLHCHAGRPEEAAAPVDRALTLADGTGERYDLASARNASGMRFRLLGDLARAAYHHTQALEWARSAGIQETEANALIGLAEVALADDRLHDAIEAARLAVEVATSAGLRLIEADAHHALARIHDARGDMDAACKETAVALRLCEITGYRLREAAIRADEMVSNS